MRSARGTMRSVDRMMACVLEHDARCTVPDKLIARSLRLVPRYDALPNAYGRVRGEYDALLTSPGAVDRAVRCPRSDDRVGVSRVHVISLRVLAL